MKIVAAYLLALLGGKARPGPDDIKAILGSGVILVKFSSPQDVCFGSITFNLCGPGSDNLVGADADEDKLELFFKELGGKDVNEVLALGREKFAAGGGGGGAGVAVASGGGGGGGGDAAPVEEEKKEEKKEEKEESDEDMGFSLFD